MLLYPTPLDDYPENWIQDLLRFEKHEDQLLLERKKVEGLIEDPSLIEFYQRRKELIDVPFAPELSPMPETHFTFLYVVPKKQHEIRRLAPLIDEIYRSHGIQKIIDIGGGIGLLAQSLNNQYGHKVTTVDVDPVMQKTGFERHLKNAKNPDNLVDYKNVMVLRGDTEFSELISPETMTVGLHTCGPLAVAQLEASVKQRAMGIVNFGCCYHKLGDNDGSQNISRFVRESGPLHLSQFALTLASRAHLKLPEKDFDFKLKVKHFRYALHFLLYDHYGIKKQVTLGNSPRPLYEGKFSAYALEQMRRLDLKPTHSEMELNDYFLANETQDLIRRMLAGGTVRDAFGRLLELYIQLDRVVFLEEQGHKVELLQCFDEIISPRNLGIFSTYQVES